MNEGWYRLWEVIVGAVGIRAGVIAVAFALLVVLDERRKKAPPMKGS
ncbi:hypothetical protein [Amycolatopsis saalfeldensis]|uniref:Uncharacterized protein n=1 Tax=Amycolatopsis saalfeldensis TaxID=394193 RepID=A0A1H8RLR3_9PSEU|nr:hypothetical protein [Amycolatopsis saalfeldensis]SEO67296.1 hypothetical protein SAMN04489732_101851 [Amycolatopsis saalfeldensis]